MEFSLKKRIILPLLLTGMMVFLLGIYLFKQSETQQMTAAVRQDAEALQSHLQSMLLTHTEMLAASMEFIVQDQHIVAALKARDRAALSALSQPIYQRLKRDNHITHFYFHDMQRVNLLRVHQPARNGDVIDRYTLRMAEKTAALASGVELGPLGTFTLRAVLPVLSQGERVGYIELGLEVDDLIQQAHKMFGVELYVLINKNYLAREQWQRGMVMLHRPANWDLLPSAVIAAQSLSHIPPQEWLMPFLSAPIQRHHIATSPGLFFDQRDYLAARIDFPDVAGRPVATLLMLRDMSEMLAHSNQNMRLFAGISMVMGAGIVLLFWAILGRTEEELVVTRQRLLNESQAKSEMHEAFIQQLLEEQIKLSDSEERIKLLLNSVGEGIYGVDLDGNLMFINPAACQMLGYTQEELFGQNVHDLVHHTHPDGSPYPHEDCPIYESLLTGRSRHITDDVLWRKDHQCFPVDYVSAPIWQGEKHAGAVVVFSDITERKQAHMQIERALHVQRVMDTILNISLPPLTLEEVLLLSLDAVLSIPAFALLSKGAVFLVGADGVSLEMIAQRNLPEILLQRCGKLAFGQCLCGTAAATREMVFVNRLTDAHEITYHGIRPHGHYCLPIMSEGELLGVLNTYVPENHPSDEEEHKYLKTVADTMAVVIKRKKDEEALRQLAHHDVLTGLPNRILFYDRLEQVLAVAQRQSQRFAVLFLDLDKFKEINDTLGHDAGDDVLREVAQRLRTCVSRKTDTVARMGGDEFTIIFTDVNAVEYVASVAERIIIALSQSFLLHGETHFLGCSIGIAQYPQQGEDAETLIKHADDAMYQAKKQRNTYRFYTPE